MGADHERVCRALLRVVGFTCFFTFPAFALIAVLSEPLVVTLLGPAWRDAGPVLAALCAGGVLFSVSHFNAPVLAATGQTALLFRYMLADAVLIFVAVAVGSMFGVVGVAIAFAGRVCILLPVSVFLVHRAVGLSPRRWLSTVLPPLLAALVSTSLLATLHYTVMSSLPAPVRLAALVVFFVPLHALVALTLIPSRCKTVVEELSRLMPRIKTASDNVRRWRAALQPRSRRPAG
jgi:O-antigen/teichoic acid export membrane protein